MTDRDKAYVRDLIGNMWLAGYQLYDIIKPIPKRDYPIPIERMEFRAFVIQCFLDLEAKAIFLEA